MEPRGTRETEMPGEKPGLGQDPVVGGLGCWQIEMGLVLRVEDSWVPWKEMKLSECCEALPKNPALLSGPVGEGKE